MKIFSFLWYLLPHLCASYIAGSQMNTGHSEVIKFISIPAISSDFNQTLNNVNGYFFIVPISIVVFFLIFLWVKFKSKTQLPKPDLTKEESDVKLLNSNLNENTHEVSPKIIILEETEQRILDSLECFEKSYQFNQREISLYNLSHQINTNTKYLSSIIKKHKNKSFNSYINELRIQYIVRKLKENPAYLNYKISHLAEEVGFSSHSAFSSVFYQIIGITPSVFIKNLKEKSKDVTNP